MIKQTRIRYLILILGLLFLINSKTYHLRDLNTPLLLISIPKSGTHLLGKVLYLMLEKLKKSPLTYSSPLKFNNILIPVASQFGNKFYGYHLPYNEENVNWINQNQIRTLFMYRDPRDVIVSFAYHAQRLKWYDEDISVIITMLINNFYAKSNNGIGRFLPWKDKLCSVKFESLVGEKGGGNDIWQEKEIVKIATYLGIELSAKEKSYIKDNVWGNLGINGPNNVLLFNNFGTFRKGTIGQWKQEFTDFHKKLFKSIAGQELINLGYERNNDW